MLLGSQKMLVKRSCLMGRALQEKLKERLEEKDRKARMLAASATTFSFFTSHPPSIQKTTISVHKDQPCECVDVGLCEDSLDGRKIYLKLYVFDPL